MSDEKTLVVTRMRAAPDPLPSLGRFEITRSPDAAQVGRTFPIRGEETGIGRASGNAIAINDPEMSAYHARILVRDGQILLSDTGSTNGTYVNGTRTSRDHRRRLCVGDVLLLGATAFVYRAIEE
jgi:pSer/pThr/pTyr-binding forkhead associated (FHA) protein